MALGEAVNALAESVERMVGGVRSWTGRVEVGEEERLARLVAGQQRAPSSSGVLYEPALDLLGRAPAYAGHLKVGNGLPYEEDLQVRESGPAEATASAPAGVTVGNPLAGTLDCAATCSLRAVVGGTNLTGADSRSANNYPKIGFRQIAQGFLAEVELLVDPLFHDTSPILRVMRSRASARGSRRAPCVSRAEGAGRRRDLGGFWPAGFALVWS